MDVINVTFCMFYSPDPCRPGQPKPALAADSEVYKMLQENQEINEPPRQSASFKVLQEILETGIISYTPCIQYYIMSELPIGHQASASVDKMGVCDSGHS